MEVEGEGDYILIATLPPPDSDSCINMGSNESHFNVSVGSDGQSHKKMSTNYNLFEEKGEPKRYPLGEANISLSFKQTKRRRHWQNYLPCKCVCGRAHVHACVCVHVCARAWCMCVRACIHMMCVRIVCVCACVHMCCMCKVCCASVVCVCVPCDNLHLPCK